MGDKISIIIPVYNVEQYLEKCVKSVINQTYNNLEIILVNDGSTDRSGLLCDNLGKKDSRIKVIHKKNGGLSDARNVGIDNASGGLIGFIDSDDYIDTDMYEILYKNLIKYNADMSMCGHYDIYNKAIPAQAPKVHEGVLTKKLAAKMVLEAKVMSVTAVNKLYKKDLFYNLRYDIGRIAEDAFIILKLINKCERISYTNQKKYYYVHREGSITTSKFSYKYLDVIDAYNQNYNIVKDNYPELEYQAKTRIMWSYFYVLDRLLLDDEYNDHILQTKLLGYLKKNKIFILKNTLFTANRKILYTILLFNEKFYTYLIRKFK